MRKSRRSPHDITRRRFVETAAGTGALLTLSPKLLADDDEHEHEHRRRTWFVKLSHESYSGTAYYMLLGRHRYQLRELERNDAALERARRSNRFLSQIPDHEITHAVEGVQASGSQVLLSYLVSIPTDIVRSEWKMSAFFLLPPASSYAYAYRQMRKIAKHDPEEGGTAPLSTKRRKYGLPPAASLRDLLEEQVLLDATDWAAAMVNVHPELLSADPDSAAHIQTNYIKPVSALFQLHEVLMAAGPATKQTGTGPNANGWATLVPYTDENGKPLVSSKGNNAGLDLYDAQWSQGLTQFVSPVMKKALHGAKNDTTLGADVTSSPATVPAGTIWTRQDGIATIDQSPGASPAPTGPGNTAYTLSNVTPYFNGYSCSNGVYRLDIYPQDSTSGLLLSTTQGFNAAKVTVDYWRNVYSLNYEVLMTNGALPVNGVTEPSVSQRIPATPPACAAPATSPFPNTAAARFNSKRLLRWSPWLS